MPDITIREAPEAEQIAKGIINEFHPHLKRARILFLFTTQRRKKCDRVKLGSAAKMSAIQRFLASGMESVDDGPHFLILIGDDEWRELTAAQRRALVDHELMHCGETVKYTKRGDVKRRWSLKGHDVEEFQDIIARHGFWKTDVENFGKEAVRKAQQLALPTEDNATPERELVGAR